jgi:hypothetical protein
MDLPVGENLEDHLKFFMKYTINQTYGINEDAIKDVRSRIMYDLFGKGMSTFILRLFSNIPIHLYRVHLIISTIRTHNISGDRH